MKRYLLIVTFATVFQIDALTIGQIKPPRPTSPSLISHTDNHTQQKKKYTLLIYQAADNDLYPFAGRNIRQLQTHGSNEHINILIHLDIHLKGQSKVTKRFFVEKNKLVQVGPDQQMDSGDPKTLVDFFKWSHENYPADHYCLDLWNHGTGFIDPNISRTINPSGLFFFNTKNKMIELDRRIGFIDFITSMVDKPTKEIKRGICFDETTGNYLSNKNLREALNEITKMLGRKLDIILFDACLMQMWEILRIIEPFANYSVGSQEVELGTGYNYSFLLEPFAQGWPTPHEFSKHAVSAYERAYARITNDYTQSAVILDGVGNLDLNINALAEILVEGLQKQQNGSVKETLRVCRNKRFCTQFDEPSYIDLQSFLNNLLKNYDHITLKNSNETTGYKQKLKTKVEQAGKAIDSMVIAKCAGKNLPSGGISIYFPERRIHPSCYSVPGIETNRWLRFVNTYLGS